MALAILGLALLAVARAALASESIPTCSDGPDSSTSCTLPKLASDRGLSLFQVIGAKPISAALMASEVHDGLSGSRCGDMPNVERVCSADGCKVLAGSMRGKTCAEYCARSGRSCVGAWEEVEENCEVKADLRCDQTYQQTSDLICECSNTVEEHDTSVVSSSIARDSLSNQDVGCPGMPDVELQCSSNGCKVLAGNMREKTCSEYCARSGRICVGAWEEVEENCEVKADLQCDQTYEQTSDLLCECSSTSEEQDAPPDTPTEAPVMPESPATPGRCEGMPDVEQQCSTNGCKVLAGNMRGKTCTEYCARSGRSCVGAWEEVEENCEVKATLTCGETYFDTSDLLCECAPGSAAAPPSPSSVGGGRRLVWSDEFDGSSVDGSKWSVVNKGGGFGNRELQYYTARDTNVRVENGALKLSAMCEWYQGHSFTSAKLESKHKGDWGPGHRVEVRARLPTSKGTWPAIWMLPTQNAYGGWPHSGEIDIMEVVGCTQDKVHGTVHTGTYNHMRNTEQGGHTYTGVAAWHVYAIEWTASEIVWFLDGQRYYSFAAPGYTDTGKWPFDQDFFLILNLAVGGTWGGWCVEPKPSCSDPAEFGQTQVMEVDYARVYAL